MCQQKKLKNCLRLKDFRKDDQSVENTVYCIYLSYNERVEPRLTNNIDTKTKCDLKKFAGNRTLRQVIIRVCRQEIKAVMLVFSTSFVS
jgi:hypothetical protein